MCILKAGRWVFGTLTGKNIKFVCLRCHISEQDWACFLQMCSCKEFIAQELLKTLVSAEITDQDAAVEPRTALRLLQHNIRFLLQNPVSDFSHMCFRSWLNDVLGYVNFYGFFFLFMLFCKIGEHCLKDKVMVRKINLRINQEFIRRCFTFFQDWMSKCITGSDFWFIHSDLSQVDYIK